MSDCAGFPFAYAVVSGGTEHAGFHIFEDARKYALAKSLEDGSRAYVIRHWGRMTTGYLGGQRLPQLAPEGGVQLMADAPHGGF